MTLADTHWFGPFQTWPKELYNYPYIEFRHRLDSALKDENIPGMGQALISDSVWDTLFYFRHLIRKYRYQDDRDTGNPVFCCQ